MGLSFNIKQTWHSEIVCYRTSYVHAACANNFWPMQMQINRLRIYVSAMLIAQNPIIFRANAQEEEKKVQYKQKWLQQTNQRACISITIKQFPNWNILEVWSVWNKTKSKIIQHYIT